MTARSQSYHKAVKYIFPISEPNTKNRDQAFCYSISLKVGLYLYSGPNYMIFYNKFCRKIVDWKIFCDQCYKEIKDKDKINVSS